MIKKALTALVLFITTLGFSQKTENSLLWKLSGNGLSKPSYLYGTIHITCDATLDKNVLAALDATQQLYLELDMNDPALQAEMMGGMMMKDGKKMSQLVNEEDFEAVNKLLMTNIGVSAKMLDNIKPSMVSMMLLPKMIDCPMQSVEAELMKVTAEQGEEVYGLETVAAQMDVFDAIPYEEQMEELVKTAKDNMEADREKYKRMIALYNSKDLNAIMEFMKEEENKMYDDHSDVMLDNRNKNWIAKIEEAAKTTPTFFGVGAAHLPGENGVINLLRKQGYKVEAVK
ncbi:TraB/GumN family protein [Flavobacterium salilacus subsp. salilacus]|uniref:TraB/GumN family protein n=1 Tax=Flavobacterium TaxID=237 RepID=UPI001075177B|nr:MULTISPECIES: TraB/GumN family protein [Flavobacterium]KAF2516818.1 TraB/GumN family protein [Flavobacterium salilacus subsp. salilacus]MBE1615823.1 TraB/GumN family protein [Flavobacterium sp. SaA2.13]NDI99796.1 TraB/GumN family protein [Flavobacterium salilacus subsp. altitudinum]